MPSEAPIYEELKEANDIMDKIIVNNPNIFGVINPNKIGVAIIPNKDRPDSQAKAEKRFGIKGVTGADKLWSTKDYIVEIFNDVWTSANHAMRSNIMCDVLRRIPTDEPDGTLLKEDLHDLRIMISEFGMHYKDNPNVPDLTDEANKDLLKPANE